MERILEIGGGNRNDDAFKMHRCIFNAFFVKESMQELACCRFLVRRQEGFDG